jgi:hypothetical protein
MHGFEKRVGDVMPLDQRPLESGCSTRNPGSVGRLLEQGHHHSGATVSFTRSIWRWYVAGRRHRGATIGGY